MKKVVRIVPLILVYLAIIYFSIKRPTSQNISIPYFDKVGHFIAYFTLGFVIFLSLKTKILRVIFFVISLSLGITLEYIQSQLPYRDMSLFDGIANLLGLFVGGLFFLLFIKHINWLLKKLGLHKIFL